VNASDYQAVCVGLPSTLPYVFHYKKMYYAVDRFIYIVAFYQGYLGWLEQRNFSS
jgi:uncharacterized membrane protein (GlpM family)